MTLDLQIKIAPIVGAHGTPSNCEAQGNVLMIQELDKNAPDDNAGGGTMTSTYAHPVKIEDVVLMDMEETDYSTTTTEEG